jgi:predicted dehydrogenase
MDQVRIGVVGLGWVAQVFHLPLLSKFPDVKLLAVCDKNKEQARQIAEKFNVPSFYGDYEQMLAKEQLDAVIVCTSTDAHLPIALAVMESGRDVFVEKPIARLYAEAVKITEASKETKRKLMVGMNSRFRPDIMILKSMVEEGELGKVFYCKAGWLKKIQPSQSWFMKKEKSGGGVILDLGIVMLDLALWLTGFPSVVRVSAKTYQTASQSVEDSAICFIELKSGISLVLETSWSFRSENDFFYCDLYGADGSAQVNPLRIHKQLHGNIVNVTPAKIETPTNLHKKSYENELRHFIGAVRGLHPVISTGDEAVQRMKIVQGIYESAKRGKEVSFK